MTQERIAIVGAREASPETLDQVRALVRALPDRSVVVSGGARGVDAAAAEAAQQRGLGLIVYRPSPVDENAVVREMFGVTPTDRIDTFRIPFRADARVRLLYRNTLIAGCCTRMVAFVAGSRGGTWDAVAQAKRLRRGLEVVQ